MENYYVKALLNEGENYGEVPPSPPPCLSGFMDVSTACKVMSFFDTLVLMTASVYEVNSPYMAATSIASLALMFLMTQYSFYSHNSTMLRPFQILLAGLLITLAIDVIHHVLSASQSIGLTVREVVWRTIGDAALMAVLSYQLAVVTRCVGYFKLIQEGSSASESVAFNSVGLDAKTAPEYAVFSLECSYSSPEKPPETVTRDLS